MCKDTILQQIKAIADENRFKIVMMLSQNKRMCACEILEAFNFTQPALSQQMKILINANLVAAEKKGTWMYYTLDITAFENLARCIKNIANGENK